VVLALDSSTHKPPTSINTPARIAKIPGLVLKEAIGLFAVRVLGKLVVLAFDDRGFFVEAIVLLLAPYALLAVVWY
jgi:hypothetical protein